MIVERDIPVVNRAGIHARPSSEIVKTAAKFTSAITISHEGLDANAKSIMGVMMLAAGKGASVRVDADGADAERAVAELLALVARRFDESE